MKKSCSVDQKSRINDLGRINEHTLVIFASAALKTTKLAVIERQI